MRISASTKSLNAKLKKYGLLTTGVLLLPGKMQVKAAIIYTDIADVVLTDNDRNFFFEISNFFDIDGDGTDDFRFSSELYYYGGSTYGGGFQGPIDPHSLTSPGPVSLGSIFSANSTRSPFGGRIRYNRVPYSSSDQYMGLEFRISGSNHYAWIRYETSTSATSSTVILKDWAYESVSGAGIEVGATGGALPIELVSFDARLQNDLVILDWSTASELDNKGFYAQRSADGVVWESIAFVEGNGTTDERHDYQVRDEAPLPGQSYYRLQQLDFDGTAEYSKVRSISVQQEKASFKVFPNPVSGNEVSLNFDLPTDESAQISITDMTGRQIIKNSFAGKKGLNFFRPDLSGLAKGVYIARIQLKDEVLVREFIKE